MGAITSQWCLVYAYEVKAGIWWVCSVKTVWSIIPERFRGELLTMGRYTNLQSYAVCECLTLGQSPTTKVYRNQRGWRSARAMIDDRPPSVTEWTAGHVTMIMWLGISRRRQNGVTSTDRVAPTTPNNTDVHPQTEDRRTDGQTQGDRDGKAW